MDHRTALLVAWLGAEGERHRQFFPLPRPARDPAWRGWVHVGVCVLGGALVGGLFVCWLAMAWQRAGPASLAERNFGMGGELTLPGARVEGIARPARAGRGTRPWTLTVRYRGVLVVCEFREGRVPRDIRVGDTVSIRSAAGRDERETGPVLLKDCEVIEGPSRAKE